MRVLVAGSSGFVGSHLVAALSARGDDVVRLVRRPPGPGEAQWDPAAGTLDPSVLEGIDAVVSLGGENIAGGRWTEARKRVLTESRVGPTALLSRVMSTMATPPAAWVSCSAEGFYGHRGDTPLPESEPPGEGFLAELCTAWEAATGQPPGVRVVHARLGVVIGSGGAIEKMKLPFSLGLGGPIGSGEQWIPWVSMHDAVRGFLACIDNASLSGPVNLVHPEPVRQREFARALGAALERPAFLPTPGLVIAMLYGEMGTELILHGRRVVPQVLLDHGFQWEHALAEALREASASERGG
ncbi:MAG: TIGR01777 family oxidoreductase [Deltaproteobacteria bacterium]|nr:TIGR01777 family oxidoreductase [Deltaproteobacteria bacterium]